MISKVDSARNIATMLHEGWKVYFLDQTSFNTCFKTDKASLPRDIPWSKNSTQINGKYDTVSLNGIASLENGLEVFKVSANSMDGKDFGIFVTEWAQSLPRKQKSVLI